MPFERWNDRIAAAGDERARRQLLAEIGRSRAGHLTDIPALREAAFAMSRLYQALGEHEAATREAKSLLSLCQTPPLATGDELRTAQAWLQGLGAKGVVAAPPPPARPERPARPRREKRPAGGPGGERDQVRRLAAQGRWDEALSALEGARGPRAVLLRTWIGLASALQERDATTRDHRLRDLEARLREQAIGQDRPERREPAPRPPQAPEHPLEAVVGQRVPKKWRPRLAILEEFLAAHPDRVDEVAALALDHHVAVSGERAPAPWLIGIVGQALGRGRGEQTRQKVDELTERGAYAVTAYGEWPFAKLVEVIRAARDRDWKAISLRRGVSSRGEPRDRKLWTLRYSEAGVERMAVVGAPAEQPYPEGMAAKLAERIPHLCPRSLLVAPGTGYAELRAEAARLGVEATEDDDPAAILAALDRVTPVEAPAEAAAPPSREEDVLEALGAALAGGATEDDLVAILARLPRVHPAFRVARDALDALSPAEREERAVAFLHAAHRAAPERARLPEGITLAARIAASPGSSGAAREVLVGGETAHRYGGPGVETIVDLVGVAQGAGFGVARVLRGPTARERRGDPVLQALGEAADGVWRLLVERDDKRGEIWFLADVSPEGRAAVPRLMGSEYPRVVVLPDDPGLAEWYRGVGGDAVTWTGPGSAPALQQALAALT